MEYKWESEKISDSVYKISWYKDNETLTEPELVCSKEIKIAGPETGIKQALNLAAIDLRKSKQELFIEDIPVSDMGEEMNA